MSAMQKDEVERYLRDGISDMRMLTMKVRRIKELEGSLDRKSKDYLPSERFNLALGCLVRP